MDIFEQEIRDGLEKAIAEHMSVACMTEVNVLDTPSASLIELGAVAAEIQNQQKDLFYLDTILVSTGWNKNDDVFLTSEVWGARHTPDNKPFNYNHDCKDIIGHILSTVAVSDDYQSLIKDDISLDSLPEKYHLKTSAVLYKVWQDENLQNRMNQIIADIAKNKWFVSMEALFAGFDYSIITPENTYKVIARNEKTSFLTKHLRIFGGTGVYENYRVGRILKNITFSGKGLVQRPANPESVILNTFGSFTSVDNIETKNKECVMSVDLERENTELKAKVASLTEAKAALEDHVKKGQDEKVSALEKTLTGKDEAIAALTAELEAAKKNTETVSAELDTVKKELAKEKEDKEKMKKDHTAKCRLEALVAVGKNKDEAEQLVAKFDGLNDDQFSSIVDIMKTGKAASTTETNSTTAGETVLNGSERENTSALSVDVAVSEELKNGLSKTFAGILGQRKTKKE